MDGGPVYRSAGIGSCVCVFADEDTAACDELRGLEVMVDVCPYHTPLGRGEGRQEVSEVEAMIVMLGYTT